MNKVPNDVPRTDELMVRACTFRPDGFCTLHGGIHTEPESDPDRTEKEPGYAAGYVDGASTYLRRHHEREIERIEREHQAVRHPDLVVAAFSAVWELRPDMTTAEFAEIARAVVVDSEVCEALIRLWDLRDRLTAAEIALLRAACEVEPAE